MFVLTGGATQATDAQIQTNTANAATSVASLDTKTTTTANGIKVDIGSALQPASSAVTSVASSATNVQLLALNTSRKGMMIFNDSTANLYLKLGTTASTSSFTIKMPPTGYFELANSAYTGEVDGIWDAANGFARVTELS